MMSVHSLINRLNQLKNTLITKNKRNILKTTDMHYKLNQHWPDHKHKQFNYTYPKQKITKCITNLLRSRHAPTKFNQNKDSVSSQTVESYQPEQSR